MSDPESLQQSAETALVMISTAHHLTPAGYRPILQQRKLRSSRGEKSLEHVAWLLSGRAKTRTSSL